MADEATHLHVEFFSKAVQDKAKSAAKGRPIFEDIHFVRIRFRGDKHRIHVAPATECAIRHPVTNLPWSYKDRFPKHYEAFLAGLQYHGDGTPLAELPFLTEAKRAELRALNIHTAEALAGLDGSPLSRLGPGGRGLKDQATAWLAKAHDSALETRLAGENAELREQLALLSAQVNQLAQVGAVAAPSAATFAGYSDDDIKAMIADRTGTRPRGNPSRATLERMAEEMIAAEKAEAA